MTRSKRMQPVVDVARKRQEDAARQMGERQRDLDAQIARLEELNTYRAEYARRFEEGAESMTGVGVRDYRLFLTRLNQAIEEQARRVERARLELARSRSEWTASRIRSDAIDKAVDRFRQDESCLEQRREQARNDEFGQRPRREQD
jgi:flagellar protein FliJ